MILAGLTYDLQSSLFSAVVTAFLVRTYDDLQPNYQQQTALLLHQLLNGRDPDLAIASDPTIPYKPTGPALAVHCIWSISLAISLSACIYIMSLKWWFAQYDSGAKPVGGLLRACRRHTRFMVFERSNIQDLVTFLPILIVGSIAFFFVGCILSAWQTDRVLMIAVSIVSGTFAIAYALLFIFPSVENFPLCRCPTFISYRPSFGIRKAVISIVGILKRLCLFTLRCVGCEHLLPLTETVPGTLIHWYMQTQTTPPRKDEHTRGTASHDTLVDIDATQNAQDEAILWLSQVPLDPPESKALVSSLALRSSSHSYGRFQKSVTALANLVLEALFRQGVFQEQANTAIDCVLVLGNIKFQSAVDQNSDSDHTIGETRIPPSVAWAAQQLTIDAFRPEFDNPHSEGIRERLLIATAWLSPVGGAKDVEWDGQELKIQDRWQFVEKIRMMLESHVHDDKPLDNKVLINLIHGMHACIPRGTYGSASPVVSFLPLFCKHYDPPGSEDKDVLGALITYVLDLLLPDRRKPLVDRRIGFDGLVSELIDVLRKTNPTPHSDVVTFALWLARRVPHAFRSGKTVLTDIASIWVRANEAIPEDSRELLNFHATDAFIAVAQHHSVATDGLPRLTDYTPLKLLSVALERGHSRPMTVYTMAMILNLGTLTRIPAVTSEIRMGSITDALFSSPGDLETGATEEDAIDIRIYSTLILLKLSPTVELDVEKVKGLIVQTEEAIDKFSVKVPGGAKDSEADIGVDLDRARWKAIYLSALLFKFLPDDGRGEYIEGLWTRVQVLVGNGELSFMDDYRSCLKPLGVDVSQLESPAANQQDEANTVFGKWISGFPLLQLAGTVEDPPSSQMRTRPWFFNPGRWFG
jgi:hypothetical protein